MCVSIIRATQTNRKHAAGCDRVSGSPEFNHQSSTSMPGTSEMRRDSLWKYLSRDTPKFLLGFPIVLTVLILFFVRLFLFVAGIFIIVVLPCNFDGWRRHKMPEWWRHQYDLPAGKCFHAARKNILGVGAMWVGGGGACASAVYVCVSF